MAAAPALKPKRIAGCGGLTTRHDAMLAGESGADYVMFGEPDATAAGRASRPCSSASPGGPRFLTIPCVGYAASLDEVAALAQAGADFVAIGENVWRGARAPRSKRSAQRLSVGAGAMSAAALCAVALGALLAADGARAQAPMQITPPAARPPAQHSGEQAGAEARCGKAQAGRSRH